jgi:hypothetical protein
MVHTMVAESFIGLRPEGQQCCHSNGVKTDNRACNLRWDTAKGNHSDRARHGTLSQGASNGNAVLTAEEVGYARRLHASGGFTLEQLGFLFDTAATNIHSIVTRKTWRHLT